MRPFHLYICVCLFRYSHLFRIDLPLCRIFTVHRLPGGFRDVICLCARLWFLFFGSSFASVLAACGYLAANNHMWWSFSVIWGCRHCHDTRLQRYLDCAGCTYAKQSFFVVVALTISCCASVWWLFTLHFSQSRRRSRERGSSIWREKTGGWPQRQPLFQSQNSLSHFGERTAPQVREREEQRENYLILLLRNAEFRSALVKWDINIMICVLWHCDTQCSRERDTKRANKHNDATWIINIITHEGIFLLRFFFLFFFRLFWISGMSLFFAVVVASICFILFVAFAESKLDMRAPFNRKTVFYARLGGS